jgi:mono/diheme cytochrome c family protein
MKWLKRILLGLAATLMLGVVILYGWSEAIIRKGYSAETRAVTLSSAAEVIAEGERLAQVFGCFHGCHGKDMEGDVFFEEDWVGSFYAPNLTAAVDRYSLSELEAIIRQGVRPDGSSVVGMPSDSFSIMTDEDLWAILSFISAYPKQETAAGKTSLGPLSRFGLITGEYWPAADKARSEPWKKDVRNDTMDLGQYLAMNACSECHGLELEGYEGFTPPLTIAKAYSLENFQKLMASGIGLGERDLGLMSLMSQYRLKHLTDDEVAALHTYLQSL